MHSSRRAGARAVVATTSVLTVLVTTGAVAQARTVDDSKLTPHTHFVVQPLNPDGSTPRPAANGLPGGFDVAWDSPTEGPLTFGQTAPLTVKGAAVPIDAYPRYDNPWSTTAFDARSAA